MIKSVTIVSDRDRAIRFDLQRPEKSGFAVIDIDGLGPTKNKINFSSDHALNTKHESSVPELRNITIKLQYYGLPDDIEKNRRKLYTYFGVGRIIKVIVETNNSLFETTGYTESLEPDIFSMDQTYNISIMCDSPYFKNAKDNSDLLNRGNVRNIFEFPFSNDIETKSLEFSNIEYERDDLDSMIIHNDGDLDIGFKMSFKPYKEQVYNEFVIIMNGKQMIFNSDIIKNIVPDIVLDSYTSFIINSNDGFRKIEAFYRVSGSYNYTKSDITAFLYITNQNYWPVLKVGVNKMRITPLPIRIPGITMNKYVDYINADMLYLGV